MANPEALVRRQSSGCQEGMEEVFNVECRNQY